MKNLNDIEFTEAVTQRLDGYAESIDDDILTKLNAARASALLMRQQELEAQHRQLSKIREKLIESEVLPAAIESKLHKIRVQAVAKAATRRHPLHSFVSGVTSRLFGSGFGISHGLVTACLTIAVVGLFYSVRVGDGVNNNTEDMVIIASSEELELYENLDFYLWLADNEFLN
jgi:hypothetical protein